MMKVRLLNDGGYDGFDSIAFPVEVEAILSGGTAFVKSADMIAIGADEDLFCVSDGDWPFIDNEFEVVE